MTGILHIVVARKPIEGTIAENCLKHGCGAINIDGCRIKGDKGSGVWGASNKTINPNRKFNASPDMLEYRSQAVEVDGQIGRFPANLILDESEEVQTCFPDTGVSSGGRIANISKTSTIYGGGKGLGMDLSPESVKGNPGFGDSGSASRFFFNFAEQESTE